MKVFVCSRWSLQAVPHPPITHWAGCPGPGEGGSRAGQPDAKSRRGWPAGGALMGRLCGASPSVLGALALSWGSPVW